MTIQKRNIRIASNGHIGSGMKCDCHHIFYQRTNWSRGALKVLRQHPYCKVYIPRDLHDNIHEAVKNIALPSFENAIDVLDQLRRLELYDHARDMDDLEQRLKVLIFLFDLIEPETVLCLKKQLKVVHDYYEPS